MAYGNRKSAPSEGAARWHSVRSEAAKHQPKTGRPEAHSKIPFFEEPEQNEYGRSPCDDRCLTEI